MAEATNIGHMTGAANITLIAGATNIANIAHMTDPANIGYVVGAANILPLLCPILFGSRVPNCLKSKKIKKLRPNYFAQVLFISGYALPKLFQPCKSPL